MAVAVCVVPLLIVHSGVPGLLLQMFSVVPLYHVSALEFAGT
jgi:hypothetical protein